MPTVTDEPYAYVEAERRKFDFACELIRDWSRPLVGQTLWRHTAGVDKDLRTMLLDPDAEICVYVARDTVKAHRLLSEVMQDFRSSGAPVAPHRLRVLWVPQDFDADDDAQRELVTEIHRDSVGRDILMNVVFGNLTAEDMRFFVRTSGIAGLHLALLYMISTAVEPYLQTKDLADGLGVSPGAIRERLLRLLGCGFLAQFGGGATLTKATLKARVFLDFCSELQRQASTGRMNEEMLQILRLLDMRYAPSALRSSTAVEPGWVKMCPPGLSSAGCSHHHCLTTYGMWDLHAEDERQPGGSRVGGTSAPGGNHQGQIKVHVGPSDARCNSVG